MGSDGKPHKAPPDLADLAHKWHLPLATVVDSSRLFTEYATLPREHQDEHVLREGKVYVNDMMQLVCKLADKASVDELAVSPTEIMGVVDKNMDGTVDFREFATWFHERGFEEYMNLTREQIEVRRVGQKLGICANDMDWYKHEYDKFDTNGNGLIGLDEFRELMHILLKIPKEHRIPESRMLHFWRQADSDGSGEIDLQEFVTFYIKYFSREVTEDPIEDYYKSIRRTSMSKQSVASAQSESQGKK